MINQHSINSHKGNGATPKDIAVGAQRRHVASEESTEELIDPGGSFDGGETFLNSGGKGGGAGGVLVQGALDRPLTQ